MHILLGVCLPSIRKTTRTQIKLPVSTIYCKNVNRNAKQLFRTWPLLREHRAAIGKKCTPMACPQDKHNQSVKSSVLAAVGLPLSDHRWLHWQHIGHLMHETAAVKLHQRSSADKISLGGNVFFTGPGQAVQGSRHKINTPIQQQEISTAFLNCINPYPANVDNRVSS
jgi:hypothetical protein